MVGLGAATKKTQVILTYVIAELRLARSVVVPLQGLGVYFYPNSHHQKTIDGQ